MFISLAVVENPALAVFVTALTGFLASSSGYWLYLKTKREAKDSTTQLLMGMAHDKIVVYGMGYIERGYITKDEYTDLYVYFYKPYKDLGGNGTAERIMNEVMELPLTNPRANDRLAAEDEDPS